MPATGRMIAYIRRDELTHVTIFANIIKEIRREFPEIYDDPILLIWDELTETRRAAALAKQDAIRGLGLDPSRVKTAVMYIKDSESELAPGENSVEDILEVDYFVREVPDEWLEHQTQLSHAELEVVENDIQIYVPEMQQAAYFFAQFLVPDPEMMERIVAQSAR